MDSVFGVLAGTRKLLIRAAVGVAFVGLGAAFWWNPSLPSQPLVTPAARAAEQPKSDAAAAAVPAVDPSRFEITVLASGLRQPMELAVAPNGDVYYLEIEGRLKVYEPRTGAVRLVGELKVTTAQENGLIGIALDPQFDKTGWVYLQYSPPDHPGQHVSRFTIQNGQLDLQSEKLLLKYEEQRKECCHHAGSMQFGPDGNLYIATGDNTHPHGDSQGYAPLDERPDRAPWDAQKSSSNTHSYNGKILRIQPQADGTMRIPDGNLFPRDGSQGLPEIYVMGCRNPWRMTVDSKTGFVYWGEVGPDAGGDGPRGPRGYDEINQARSAGNFGWPYFIANNQPYATVDFATGKVGEKFDASKPINRSPNNTGRQELPPAQPALLYYPYGNSTEFPELGQGGRTACAGPVYHFSPNAGSATGRFPQQYDGALFIYEWSRNWIKVVHLDEQQWVKSIEPFMPGQPFIRPIDMEFGRDGSLYLIEYGDTWGVNQNARLIRIDYLAGNRPPVAVAAVENNIGKPPLAVKLSSQGSFDKDAGDELTYEWRAVKATSVPAGNAPANNAPAGNLPATLLSREPSPTVTFAEAGVFTVELVVTDKQGAKRVATVPVVVGNERPRVRFVEPAPGDFLDPDQPIQYRLIVSDAEDGTNDFQLVDSQGLEELQPRDVDRVTVNAVYATGPIPAPDGGVADDAAPLGLRRMKRSDCFNCHAVDAPRVGPPLIEIANKYRGQNGALEASVQRVLKGSTGVWGKIPMIPHSQHTADEVRDMVSWIYSLEPAGLVRVFRGFVGEIPVAADDLKKPGYYRLEATYLDRGAVDIPALTGSATIVLRQRRIEAETADEVRGPRVLPAATA
ncbi:MAG: PQQ-dependent sugar dehydrogenase, partial [Planctomycetota bacterium]